MIRFNEEEIALVALELPDEVKFFKYNGDFAGERKAIAHYIEIHPAMPASLRRRLEIEDVIASEMAKDYRGSFVELLSKIQEKYPACKAENLEHIIDIGNADYIRKNGERYFEGAALSNILDCNARYLKSLETGETPAPSFNKLRHDNLRVMREKGYRAVRIRIKEHIKPRPSAARVGETVRIYLPFPSITPEQTDIVVNQSSHPLYISKSGQRTALIETPYKAGEDFGIDFSYTLKIPYFDPKPEYVTDHQPDFYTGETWPQIRFTPLIVETAKELKGCEKNPLILARRAYDFVTSHVVYSYMREYLCIENIPEFALLNGRGDCGVQALLFITLCRAMGVPARWQSGSHVRPTGIGSHDWAQFYVAPYGWLYCDSSFGGGAFRSGDTELWNHYACNLDVFREINATDIGLAFDPPMRFMRTDPYDNQSGEAEYENHPLWFGDCEKGREVLAFEDLI